MVLQEAEEEELLQVNTLEDLSLLEGKSFLPYLILNLG